MIGVMNIVALVAGIILGLLFFSGQTVSWLFIILHSSVFGSKKGFYGLYDVADDEVSFKFYKEHNKNIHNYADYLKIHAKAHDSAYKIFKSAHSTIVRSLLFRIIPIATIPTALFWSNWYLYLVGLLTSLICLVVYEISKNGVRPGYYQRLVIYTVLNTYQKSEPVTNR